MAILNDFAHLLPTLSRGEKAQILNWVVQDLGDDFPGIDSRPDVCGGEPCVVRTRIPVWLLEQTRRLGTSEQQLLEADPSLRAEELASSASPPVCMSKSAGGRISMGCYPGFIARTFFGLGSYSASLIQRTIVI